MTATEGMIAVTRNGLIIHTVWECDGKPEAIFQAGMMDSKKKKKHQLFCSYVHSHVGLPFDGYQNVKYFTGEEELRRLSFINASLGHNRFCCSCLAALSFRQSCFFHRGCHRKEGTFPHVLTGCTWMLTTLLLDILSLPLQSDVGLLAAWAGRFMWGEEK